MKPNHWPHIRFYLIAESALFLLFTYFLLFANTWRALADYDLIRVSVVMIAIVSSVWLALRLTRRWTAPTPLTVPLLIFLAAYLVAGLASIQPRRSLDEVWVFATYAFGFALTAQLVANGWPRELFIKTLLLAGAILMGASLYVTFAWYRSWLDVAPGQWIPDIAYRLPLANGQATYLYLLTFAVIARLQVTRARLPRILLMLWVLPAALLLFLTASRGGWLGTVTGLAVIASIRVRDAGGLKFLSALRHKLLKRWRSTLVIGILGLAALIGLGLLAVYQIQNPQKGPASIARSEYWFPAWYTFVQRPLLGQGPLTFGSSYIRYIPVPSAGFFAHAHSIFFNLLSETGLVGVAAFGGLAIATFVALWQQVNTLRGEERAVAIAALAGASAWAAHSLVDSVNVEPMNSIIMVVLLGAALAGFQTGAVFKTAPVLTQTFSALRGWWPVALGMTLSVTGIYNVWRLTPLHAGVMAARESQWPAAAAQFAEAVRRDPDSIIAHQQAGLAYSILAAEGRADALGQAIAEFELVARRDPDWWLNHANLAVLYFTQGDTAAALQAYRTAAKTGSGSPLLQMNYGATAEAAQQLEEAEQAYFNTLRLQPGWAEAYFWRAMQFRADVLREWQRANPAPPVQTLAEMETLAQGGDRAEAYTPLIAEYLKQGRLAEADQLLQKVHLAYSGSGETWLEVTWFQAELAAARGDLKSAVSLGEAATQGYMMQSAFGPGSFGAAAYGQVLFRQETMAIDLAPQLLPAPLTDRWAARWITLGEWHERLGDGASAKAIYQRVLTFVPDNIAAAEKLK